jgi:glucokinase
MFLGIDIGGTKVITALADEHGDFITRDQRDTEFNEKGGDVGYANILASCDAVLADHGDDVIKRIGICCAGPLDRKTGTILNPPNLNGWINFPLTNKIEDRYGVPALLDNDANVAAFGEYKRGAGQGKSHIAYFTVSTGIGGGIIIDGKILHGANDNAAEFGHHSIMPDGPLCGCGGRGCLESVASGTSIGRRAREILRTGNATTTSTLIMRLADGDIDKVTAAMVAEAGREGDRLAIRIWEETGFYLGLGIANVVAMINPERVIIGGGVVKAGEMLLEPVRRTFMARTLPDLAKIVDIVPAALGDDAGVVGAIELARQGSA